jgi:sulfide:quinone oxidoreductase
MATRPRIGTVSDMTSDPHTTASRPHVVIAGAGVGGLEAAVALRGLVGHRVAITLVAPQDDFSIRALEVFEPFGVGRSRRYPLTELAADLDATFVHDAVVAVEHADRSVMLRSRRRLAYDELVLAVGARPVPAYEYGVWFERAQDPEAFDEVLGDLRARLTEEIAIVVPPGATWTLPAYELALMLAAFDEPRRLTLVTPEHEPLEAFGARAAEFARQELAHAGVNLLTGIRATVPHPTVVELTPGARLVADRIVHLPALAGPSIRGVPCDERGFILVDGAFGVRGTEDVFAVGDGTAAPHKQGGLAAQQADVVAEQIAFEAGAEHPPRPYRPVLRGLIRTARGPRYLRAEPAGGGRSSEVSEQCLWWPPSKVAARWLVPWLASRDLEGRPVTTTRTLPSGGIIRSVVN